jgi:hypothetical protein
MPVAPPAPRHTLQDLGDRLIISIPSVKQWFLIVFLAVWFLGWAVGEGVVASFLIAGPGFGGAAPDGILILWLAIWTVGGGFAIYQLAWQLTGYEIIEVARQGITVSRVVFRFHTSREYSAEYVKELRVSSSNVNLNHPALWTYYYQYPWSHHSFGSLAFDYGAKTFRFGAGVDEAEAKQIMAQIEQKFPQYRN